jgi:hypothetical protein
MQIIYLLPEGVEGNVAPLFANGSVGGIVRGVKEAEDHIQEFRYKENALPNVAHCKLSGKVGDVVEDKKPPTSHLRAGGHRDVAAVPA